MDTVEELEIMAYGSDKRTAELLGITVERLREVQNEKSEVMWR